MLQEEGRKTNLYCQSLKYRPGSTTDQSWPPNKRRWRAASNLLFIMFDQIWSFGGESRCHQSTQLNRDAGSVIRASASHFGEPGSVWRGTQSHTYCKNPDHKLLHKKTQFTDDRISKLYWGIVGQQLQQFDQSLILTHLAPIKPTSTAHVADSPR